LCWSVGLAAATNTRRTTTVERSEISLRHRPQVCHRQVGELAGSKLVGFFGEWSTGGLAGS